MEGIKKFINIAVMLYLVVAALLYLDILNVGQHSNPGFYTTFFLVGGVIMLLELIIENLYVMGLKRGYGRSEQKINELKAHLYDHKQEIQDLKKRQAAEAFRPQHQSEPTPTLAPISFTSNQYSNRPEPVQPIPAQEAPLTAVPAGSDLLPPVINPGTTYPDQPVIITPGQTTQLPRAEDRLSDNPDSFKRT